MSSFETRSAPQLSLPAGSTAGNGVALDSNGATASHTLVTATTAGITAGAVQLQGSLDNVNWVNLGAAVTLTASSVQSVSATGMPFQFVRAAVTTPVTGGTVTAWVASA